MRVLQTAFGLVAVLFVAASSAQLAIDLTANLVLSHVRGCPQFLTAAVGRCLQPEKLALVLEALERTR